MERAGDQVKFVDYDSIVGDYNGRYCEPGVDESSADSNSRKGLMFYELNTWDPMGDTPWKRSDEGEAANGTFRGDVNIFSEITLLVDPEADYMHEDKVEDDASASEIMASTSMKAMDGSSLKNMTSIKAADDESPQLETRNLLPDGYVHVPALPLLSRRVTNL